MGNKDKSLKRRYKKKRKFYDNRTPKNQTQQQPLQHR